MVYCRIVVCDRYFDELSLRGLIRPWQSQLSKEPRLLRFRLRKATADKSLAMTTIN